jgi:hypothetical protein
MGRRGESKIVLKTGGTMPTYDLRHHVGAVQRDLDALFKLLGGTESERERFWEIVLGITRPAEFRLANQQIKVIHANIQHAQEGLQALTEAAREIRAGG